MEGKCGWASTSNTRLFFEAISTARLTAKVVQPRPPDIPPIATIFALGLLVKAWGARIIGERREPLINEISSSAVVGSEIASEWELLSGDVKTIITF
jgi:hypothetical protein